MKKLILLLLVFVAVQGIGQIKEGIKLETGLTVDPRFIDMSERTGKSPEEYHSSNLETLVDYNSYDISYLTLRKEYQAYCNQEVIDTLIQI